MSDSYLNAKIESLFSAADAYAGKIFPNERFRYLAWLSDPNTSQTKKDKINANLSWCDQIFAEYYARKQIVIETGEVNGDFSSFGEPPYTFYEIYSTP